MADEVKQRLQDSTQKCIQSYEAWRNDEKGLAGRETLREVIHEMRKVISRVEIEMAVSERKDQSQKPIAIPSHRNSKARPKDNDDIGNAVESQERPKRKLSPKKPDAPQAPTEGE